MMDLLKHLAQTLLHAAAALSVAAQLFVSGHLPPKLVPAPASAPAEELASSTAPITTNLFPSAPAKKAPAKAALAAAKPAVAAPSIPSAPLVVRSAEEVNAATRAALVNILCTTAAGGYFYPISGSGVFIDTEGVILTNAHVGQYFLLRDYLRPGNIDCVIRTGSPAVPKYRAQLLYLPPIWVEANASQIAVVAARGTGENDYAFLLVTATADGSPLPSSFPALTLTLDAPDIGDSVLLGGYPAGYIDGITIEKNLYASSALTNVAGVFTFNDETHTDLVSLGKTILSQAGASGGAVVRRQDGALLGLIATATEGTTTASRELRAITLSHIERSLKAQGQGGIAAFFSQNLSAKAQEFANSIAPAERQKLIDALAHQ